MLYSYNTYKQILIDDLNEILGADNVKEITMTKNNGVIKAGLCLKLGEGILSPVVYFDDTQQTYSDEHIREFKEIVRETLLDSKKNVEESMKALMDYEEMKKYVRPRLVNYKKNKASESAGLCCCLYNSFKRFISGVRGWKYYGNLSDVGILGCECRRCV